MSSGQAFDGAQSSDARRIILGTSLMCAAIFRRSGRSLNWDSGREKATLRSLGVHTDRRNLNSVTHVAGVLLLSVAFAMDTHTLVRQCQFRRFVLIIGKVNL